MEPTAQGYVTTYICIFSKLSSVRTLMVPLPILLKDYKILNIMVPLK
jgi:hypothetical protein